MSVTTLQENDLAPIVRAYTDVTERLKRSHEALAKEVCRLREELHEKNKELERRERLAALGEMAAGVAHEIRNPLGGIGLYASLLDRDLRDRPAQLDIVRKLRAGVVNLERIVGDILSFAVDSEPDLHDVRLGPVLDGALAQVLPRATEAGVVVEIDPTLRETVVRCDAGQLERAIINLAINAVEASGPGGAVRIRQASGPLRSARFEAMCRIAVEDDGPGLPVSSAQRVFDPFFTTKSTGTGLGLAIVHRIAMSHGGAVSAANRPSGGAAFVLSIPQAVQAE